MKSKKVIFLIFLVSFIIGCESNNYEDFKSAVEKTSNIEKGKMEQNININFGKEKQDLDEVKVRNIVYYKKDRQKIINYTEVDDIGYDLEIYLDKNKDDILVYLSNIGKYFKINSNEDNSNINNESISKYTGLFNKEKIEKIKNIWNELIKKENVFTGKDTIVDTKEGKVKAKKYIIKLNKEQIESLNDEFSEIFKKEIKKLDLDSIIINEINYQALEDQDGFLVKEDTNIKFIIKSDKDYNINFKFNTINYDIEQEQNITIPKVKDNEMLKNSDIKDFEFDTK
ncbi:MAG: hypothetical protein ACQEQE_08260 [Bacillota bacterium]